MTHEKSTEGRFGLEEWKKARVEAAAQAMQTKGAVDFPHDLAGTLDGNRWFAKVGLDAADAVPHPLQSSCDCATHEEMVEAVARAIYNRRGYDARVIPFEQSCEERAVCMSQAEAAIEALKPWLKG